MRNWDERGRFRGAGKSGGDFGRQAPTGNPRRGDSGDKGFCNGLRQAITKPPAKGE